MKHETYKVLKRTYLGNNHPEDLKRAKEMETNPFDVFLIDQNIQKSVVRWDWEQFTTQFRSVPPRERLDETVITFLLHVASTVHWEAYRRSFIKPESSPAWLAWVFMLKNTLLCLLGLLYDVKWTYERLQRVDSFLVEFTNDAQPSSLRELMKDLGIAVTEKTFPAEQDVGKIIALNTWQYSSFYWRTFHWMAEAHQIKNRPALKKTWRECVVHFLYRFLHCPFCQVHFQQIVQEKKEQLLDPSTDQRRMFFEIHNRVHEKRRKMFTGLREPDYTESEYEEDSKFMLQALSQP